MNLPRYVRQTDTFTCGPVAILNALKWSGCDCIKSKHLRKIIEHSRCKFKHNGTFSYYLDQSLRHFGKRRFRVRFSFYPSLNSIENHLRKSGGSIIIADLFVKGGRRFGHYSLITNVSKSGKSFTAVNL